MRKDTGMFTFNYAFSRSRLFLLVKPTRHHQEINNQKQETVKKESEEEKDPDLEKYEEIEKKMKGIKDAPSLDKLDPFVNDRKVVYE